MGETENVVEFLEVGYDSMGFLVNRSQFSNSMFIEEEKKVTSKLKYLDSILFFNNENIITFNLDYFVKELFNFEQNNSLQLALLSSVKLFSEKNQLLFKRLTTCASVDLSHTTIGIKVGSQAKITKVNLGQIKLPPVQVKKKLKEHGLLGVRFVSEQKAEYFLDLETLIFTTIIKTYRKHR